MKQKAKYKIIRNMIILLEEHPFEEITIKMICAYSGVNRTTFYDYFLDKYDLISKIQQYHLTKYKTLLTSLLSSFLQANYSKAKIYKFFKIILTYIKRNYGYFHAILVTYPNKSLFSDYVAATKSSYKEILDLQDSIYNKKQFVIYTIGGQLGIIYFWIKEGCTESEDQLAQILLANTIKLQR
ncbi:TetR/AcrR family transcriptional regulator [Staphylococcus arlettae]|uniref:TetR/AcrR family transcriptional regulator n=1 Tax=Staphylococcus arlettae TaxID=29378 RepID=UPI001BDD7C1B|nr:TetR/AcrR family transcriptional regulator [Staphylococcus arlettae]MCD8834200.1 TetR/AcrR family transcriptional regulator [Staphylococcus arlettae]MCD8864753.1 TetR/AcrR family transcriptional regulator [Staphylococcus arlettae]